MPPKTKSKRNAIAVAIPQNREAASDYVRIIGEEQRQLRRLEIEMNEAMANVKERFEQIADPLRKSIDARTEGLHTWCEANRDSLTQGGKVKTVALPAGEVAWRIRPPSVRITGAEAVLDALQRLGLTRFVRKKEEINKEAILNEPDAVRGVPGIAINQGEDFIVTPFEAELSAAEGM
jgi:phage host-nuclease inhibitor protein Gam